MTVSVSRTHPKTRASEVIGFRSFCALSYAAVTARIFYLCTIDYPEALNSAWLIPLIGALLASPALLITCFFLNKHGYPLSSGVKSAFGEQGLRLFSAIFSLVFTYESACMFRILTGSAEYAALFNMPTSALLIPTGIIILLCALRGGNGTGGAASLWLRIFPLFYIVILIMEIPSAKIGWLFPVFGPGAKTLLRGGMLCAFYFCLLLISFTIGSGELVNGKENIQKPKALHAALLYLLCAVSASILLFAHSAMFPSIPSLQSSRSIQLHMLLSNGKTNLSVQLPVLIAWFSSLFIANIYFLYVSGCFASIASGNKGRMPFILPGILALLLAIEKLSMKDGALYAAMWGYPAFMAFFIFLFIFRAWKGKRT